MIYSKWKEERSKLSEQHDLGHLQWNWANHSRKLCNANGIKAMNHILILSRSEEGTYIECEKHNSGRLLLTISESNTIQTEPTPEVQKTLICSKSREDTAESSGATRLSSKSLLQMHERENYCKQTWEKNQTSWNIG